MHFRMVEVRILRQKLKIAKKHFRMVGDLICRIKGCDLGVDWVQNRGKSGVVDGKIGIDQICTLKWTYMYRWNPAFSPIDSPESQLLIGAKTRSGR